MPVKVEWEAKNRKWVRAFSPTIRLTDAEKAERTVREFYQAVIRGDETTADRIFQTNGLVQGRDTRKGVKKWLQALVEDRIKVLRIVEVGKPVSHPESGTTEVPVKIELGRDVARGVKEFVPFVRAVHGQSDRWAIIGGI